MIVAPPTTVSAPEKAHSAVQIASMSSPLSTTMALAKDSALTTPDTTNPPTPSTDQDIDALVAHLSQNYTNPALILSPSTSSAPTPLTITLQPTPIPTPSPTQVLLHIRTSGVCGSDLHLWHTGRIGSLRITSPCTLGHEAAGEVLAVGSAVTHLRAGDRVSIEPGIPCATCWLCRAGRYNLCEGVRFCGVGTTGCEGSVRRFMTHEAAFCHRIPEEMGWGAAALLEPLAVVMHALREVGGLVALGSPLLVCGAGPIGLIALKAARASGAWPLCVTDVDEGRLEFARGFVPGVKTWCSRIGVGEEVSNAEGIRRLFGCVGDRDLDAGSPDAAEELAPAVVLECTGVESSVVTAAYTCRRGGTVMVVGVGRERMNNLPFMHLSFGEIGLKFINRYRDMWPAAINVLAGGQVMALDALITHTFPLERAVEAMQTCADRNKASIKVQIFDDCNVDIPSRE